MTRVIRLPTGITFIRLSPLPAYEGQIHSNETPCTGINLVVNLVIQRYLSKDFTPRGLKWPPDLTASPCSRRLLD